MIKCIKTNSKHQDFINLVKALDEDLIRYSQFANNALGSVTWEKLNDNQKGAITSFVYNCGVGSPPYKIWTNVPSYINGCMTKEKLVSKSFLILKKALTKTF